MAQVSASLARKAALGIATAAAMATSASAADFTPTECKGIAGLAGKVVRTIGKDTLSMEFRQSFVNWMGPEFRCDGPKEIAIVTSNDSATYRTIRYVLLALPKPISLEKAGLTPVVKSSAEVTPPRPQKHTEAVPAPAVN